MQSDAILGDVPSMQISAILARLNPAARDRESGPTRLTTCLEHLPVTLRIENDPMAAGVDHSETSITLHSMDSNGHRCEPNSHFPTFHSPEGIMHSSVSQGDSLSASQLQGTFDQDQHRTSVR